MSLRKILSFVVCLAAGAAIAEPAVPQTTAPATPAAATSTTWDRNAVPEGGMPKWIRPETPEERMTRLGTTEDPGINPEPNKVWWRFGKQWTIERFEKRFAKYSDEKPGFIRPLASVNFTEELYQDNEKYVWVWLEQDAPDAGRAKKPEKVETPAETEKKAEGIAYFEGLRNDFTPLDPQPANITLRFEESSNGLPTSGSFRNALAIGDMNEDGFLDIIVPPQRGAASVPSIFLGNAKGEWTRWQIKWPRAFNYGSVAAADVNKDGHLDLAFGIHLDGVALFLGDGKGNFKEVNNGLEKKYATRRVLFSDVNADGWPDLVAITEGPVGRGAKIREASYGDIVAFLNQKKGSAWKSLNIAPRRAAIGGDWMEAANLNGDRYPDFVASTMFFNGTGTVYLSNADGSFEKFDGKGTVIPYRSYYYGLTAGKFSSPKLDDVITTAFRSWPASLDTKLVPKPPLEKVVAVDRVSFAGSNPVRTPIMRWKAGSPVRGVAHGDLDGDGHEDLAFTRDDPRELVILLGDGAGGFRRASVDGVKLPGLRNYDLNIRDVNGDKKPDLVLMYESNQATALSVKNGRVQVFLNRGTAPAK